VFVVKSGDLAAGPDPALLLKQEGARMLSVALSTRECDGQVPVALPAASATMTARCRCRGLLPVAALADAGTLERRRLARLVRADLWGPGRFPSALRAAVAQGKVRRTGRGLHALVPAAPGPGDDSPPADHAQHGDGLGSGPEPDVIPSTQPPRDVTGADRPDGSE
jgi:hypothetical protein